ncbi:MAG: amidohydrolase family protein [Thermoleophilia bacterium]
MLTANPGTPVDDLGDVILAPGLVDAHCHTEWSLAGGVSLGPGFGRWLSGFLRVMGDIDPARHAAASDLAVMTALCNGTTTICDAGPLGAGAPAAGAAGIRAFVCHEVFGDDPASADRVAERVLELREAAGPRVQVGVSPHAPYSVGPRLWSAVLEHPVFRTGPICTHIAESDDEVQALRDGSGPLPEALAVVGFSPAHWPGDSADSPVVRLHAASALRGGMVAAHGVLLDDDDAALLAEAGVAVAHCPISNGRLGCGAMPLQRLRDAGVTVGLGTDSPASAGGFDMRAEARAAEVLHGSIAELPAPHELLELATHGSARALGMSHQIGCLAVGYRADMVAVEPWAGAAHVGDTSDAFLRGESRVRHVWVDGEAVVTDGEPRHMDRERVLTRARECRRALG